MKVGWEDVDWIHLAQDREGPLAGSCEHDNKPSGF